MSTPLNGSVTSSTENGGLPKRPDIPRTSGNFFHSLPVPQQLSQYNLQRPFPMFETKSDNKIPFLPFPNTSILPNLLISPFQPFPLPQEKQQYPSHQFQGPSFQYIHDPNKIAKSEPEEMKDIPAIKQMEGVVPKVATSTKFDISITALQKSRPFLYPQDATEYKLPATIRRDVPSGFDQIGSFPLELDDRNIDLFKFLENKYKIKDPAIKVITSGAWREKHLGKIPQALWFKARLQVINGIKCKNDSNKAESGLTTGVPLFEGKTIDLDTLKILVENRGGFNSVDLRNLWNDIGKDLGYTKECADYLRTQFENAILKTGLIKTQETEVFKKEVTDNDEIPLEKKSRSNDSTVPIITASAYEHRRTRKLLTLKGFSSKFDTLTVRKAGVNGEDDNLYEEWLSKQKDVLDCSMYDGPVYYTLDDIFKKNLDIEHCVGAKDLNDAEQLEALYWNLLESDRQVGVSTALRVTNSEAIFPKLATDNPWNLNCLSKSNWSLSKYFPSELESLAKPSLSVGMMFSTEGWTLEDHHLPLLDYNHYGLEKIWYFIPVSETLKFEALIAEISPETDLSQNFSRNEHVDPFFANYANSNQRRKLNTNYLFTPDYLKTRGISVLRVIQRPGNFILKYPGTYSYWVSLGVTVSESINFAHSLWLDFAADAELSFAKQGIISGLSTFEILINISKSCKNPTLLKTASEIFENLCKLELKARDEVRSLIPGLTEKTNKTYDYYLADDDLSISVPSVVCMISKTEHQFSMSLRNFLIQYEKNKSQFDSSIVHFELLLYYEDEKLRQFSKALTRDITTTKDWSEKLETSLKEESKPSYRLLKQLHSEGEKLFTDEYLTSVYNEDAELEYYQRFVHLGEQVEEFGNWIESAQKYLSSKHLSRKRKGKKDEADESQDVDDLDFSTMIEMIKEIPTLSFYAEEMDQLINLSMEIEDYELSARKFISTIDTSNAEDLHNILNLGKSFGIQLPSVTFLKEYEKTESWLSTFKEVQGTGLVQTFKDLESLKAYLDSGRKIHSIFQNHIDKLSKLEELCKKTVAINDQGNRILSKGHKPSEIDEISKVLQESFDYPVDPEMRINLLKIKAEYEEVAQKSRKFIDTIEEVDALKNTSLYVDLLETLPKFQQIKTLVERAHSLKVIIPDSKKLEEVYFKKAEELVRSLKKSLHRQNASASSLKTYLSSLATGVKASIANELDNLLIGTETGPSSNANIYCICRLGESGLMVECERCSEWYHLGCFNLNKIKMKNKSFVCPICDENDEHKELYEGMKTQYKPDAEELTRCFKAANALKYFPAEEFLALKEINQDLTNFGDILQTNLQWENQQLVETDIHKVKFYLRKLTGCPLNLKNEIEILTARLNILVSSKSSHDEGPTDVALQLFMQLQRLLSENGGIVSAEPEVISEVTHPSSKPELSQLPNPLQLDSDTKDKPPLALTAPQENEEDPSGIEQKSSTSNFFPEQVPTNGTTEDITDMIDHSEKNGIHTEIADIDEITEITETIKHSNEKNFEAETKKPDVASTDGGSLEMPNSDELSSDIPHVNKKTVVASVDAVQNGPHLV